jgi:hypothetical protein
VHEALAEAGVKPVIRSFPGALPPSRGHDANG